MKKNSNRNSITQKDCQNTKDIVDQILKDSSELKISDVTKKMIDNMLDRYCLHMENAYIAQMRYRYWGTLTTILLSILGATVAVIIPIIEIPKIVIALIGVLIVLSVTISNTYQFSVNFEKCANFLIQLRDWSTDMEIKLSSKINSYPNISEDQIRSFIKDKD